jgi:adenylosuccinate synthase
LVVGGEKVVLHLVPSGALHEKTRCMIGPGTVVDPRVLVRELDVLRGRGLLDRPRVLVSERAHVVLPHHIEIDGLREEGEGAIGTTKRGIGPAYEDKVGRRGLRIGDLLRPKLFAEKLAANLEQWKPFFHALGAAEPDAKATVEEYVALGEKLRPYVADTSRVLCDAIALGQKVLLEGAQGTMLDVDHGTYPYVTSSTVIAGGASAGAGISPRVIDKVVGISKAYTTRVGGGPFPTELHGEVGDRLRAAGAEFGATTGRPRRCGWLDVPALKLAVRINGMTELALTKLDVLRGFDELSICTAYELDGATLDEPPYEGLERVRPVYETMPGWTEDIAGCASVDALPDRARAYVKRIEDLAGCPVGLVSVGADRDATLRLTNPFA